MLFLHLIGSQSIHPGVLFLDELPEFNRRSLEALRQPLEEGRVTISRAAHSSTFPADFVLIAAMNPCPCGYLGDPKHVRKCASSQVGKYVVRIGWTLLDRIDLHIEVPPVPFRICQNPVMAPPARARGNRCIGHAKFKRPCYWLETVER